MYIGATTGVGTGATTGVGKRLCNSLIIKLGVRGVTKRQKNIVVCTRVTRFKINSHYFF